VLHVVTVVPDFGMSVVGTYFEKGSRKSALHEVGEELAAWVVSMCPTRRGAPPCAARAGL
jgi:hypothetical protein